MKTLRTVQLRIAFIAAAAILVSLSAYAYVRISNLMQITSWVNHTATVKLDLEMFYSEMRGMESAMRGYLLSRDSIYIHEFEDAEVGVSQKLAALKINVQDNYSQRKNLEQLQKLVGMRRRNMQYVIETGSLVKIPADRRAEFRKTRKALRAQVTKMRNEEDMLLRIRKRTLIKERTLTPVLAGTLTLGSILVLMVSYFAIFRQLRIATELREDLEENNASLEKMNRELESFTYISSHDLQEPLRKIQTFVSILLEKESGSVSETGRHYLQRVQLSANRMQNLIRDLLAYSRLKVEVFPVQLYDIAQLVAEIREDFDHTDQLRISVSGEQQVPVIVSQFRQLLSNFVSNAIKFSKAGQATVMTIDTVRVDAAALPSHAKATVASYYKMTVSDEGIGFDPQYKERIFNVFQRLHIEQNYEGTGIGLAIVKRIVDNHQGFITADGAPGQGATFTLYLPAQIL